MKRITSDRKPAHRGEAVILFGVGELMFAVSAVAVDEIRNVEGLKPIGVAGDLRVPKVKFRLVRDGRTYYVVDAAQHFRILPEHMTRVLVLRNSRVAVLVSHIDRMTEIGNVIALPRAFTGEERKWYRGLTVLDSPRDIPAVVPVVKPEAFLTEAELATVSADEPRKDQVKVARG